MTTAVSNALLPRVNDAHLSPPGGWRRVDVLAPLAVFVVLFVVKLALLLPATAGPTITDEVYYWRFAQALADGQIYESTQYPPGYPLAIAPAFLLPGDPYRTILVLNALYSSLVVFPVFWMGRLVMGVRESLAVVILQSLLPYHYIVPRALLSENTHLPLFFGVMLMVLWRPAHPRWAWAWDAATGVGLAALYLTRYVSLPLMPALIAIWWMRERHHSGRWRLDPVAWGRLAAMVGVALLAFVPWVVAHTSQGTELVLALGFGITSRADPAQLTIERLWMYVRMYLGYFALLGAPVLGLVLLSVRQAVHERAVTTYTRLVSAVGLIGLSLLVALSRHSWRAHYNYPDPLRIMGRYTIYLAVLFLVLAFAAFVRARREQREHTGMDWPMSVVWIVGLPAILVGLGYWAVLGDAVMPLTAGSITDRGSIDAYRIVLMGGGSFAALTAVTWIATMVLTKLPSDRDTLAVWLVALCIAVYSVVGVPQYFARMDRHQLAARQAHEIMRFYDERYSEQAIHAVVPRELSEASALAPRTITITYRMLHGGRAMMVTAEAIDTELFYRYRPDADVDWSSSYEVEVVFGDSVPAGVTPLHIWEIDGVPYAIVPR